VPFYGDLEVANFAINYPWFCYHHPRRGEVGECAQTPKGFPPFTQIRGYPGEIMSSPI